MANASTPGQLGLSLGARIGAEHQTTLAEIAANFRQPTLADLAKEAVEKFEAENRLARERLVNAARESVGSSFAAKMADMEQESREAFRSRAQALTVQWGELQRHISGSLAANLSPDLFTRAIQEYRGLRLEGRQLVREVETTCAIEAVEAETEVTEDGEAELVMWEADLDRARLNPRSDESRIAVERVGRALLGLMAHEAPDLVRPIAMIVQFAVERTTGAPKAPRKCEQGTIRKDCPQWLSDKLRPLALLVHIQMGAEAEGTPLVLGHDFPATELVLLLELLQVIPEGEDRRTMSAAVREYYRTEIPKWHTRRQGTLAGAKRLKRLYEAGARIARQRVGDQATARREGMKAVS